MLLRLLLAPSFCPPAVVRRPSLVVGRPSWSFNRIGGGVFVVVGVVGGGVSARSHAISLPRANSIEHN